MSKRIAFTLALDGGDDTLQSLSKIEIRLGELSKEIKTTQSDIDKYNSATKAQKDAMDAAGKSLDQLNKKYTLAKAEQIQLRNEKNNLNKTLRDEAKAFELIEKKVPKDSLIGLRQVYRELRKEIDLMDESARNSVDGLLKIKEAENVKKQIDDIGESLRDYRSQVGSYKLALKEFFDGSGGIKSLSLSLTDIVSGGLITGGIQAAADKLVEGVKVLFDINSVVSDLKADVAKVTNLTNDEVNQLYDNLERLDTRTTIEDLLGIATAAGRLGVTGVDGITAFTEATDKLIVGLGDDLGGTTDEVVTQVGKLSNVLFGVTTDGEEMAQRLLGVGNAVNKLAASSSAEADNIVDISGRIAGLLEPLNATEGQILGLATTLDELGVNPERGAGAIVRIIQKIGSDIPLFAKQLGIQEEALRKAFNTDPIEALQLATEQAFRASGGESDVLVSKLKTLGLNGVGATEIFLKLGNASERLGSNIDVATEAFTNYDSLQTEVDKKNENLAGSFARLQNRFKETFLSSGIEQFFSGVVDGLSYLFDLLSPVGEAITDLFNEIFEGAEKTEFFERVINVTTAGLRLMIVAVTDTIQGLEQGVRWFKAITSAVKETIDTTPVLSTIFRAVGEAINYIYDKIANLPAVIAGTNAAVRQFFDNIGNLDFSTSVSDAYDKAYDRFKVGSEKLKKQRDTDITIQKNQKAAADKAFAEQLAKSLEDEEKLRESGKGGRAKDLKDRDAELEKATKIEIEAIKERINRLREADKALAKDRITNAKQLSEQLKKIDLKYDIDILNQTNQFNAPDSSAYLKALNEITTKTAEIANIDIKLKLVAGDEMISNAKDIATKVATQISDSEEELAERVQVIRLSADLASLNNRLKFEKLSVDERLKLEEDKIKKEKELKNSQASLDVNYKEASGDIKEITDLKLTELARSASLEDLKEYESDKKIITLEAALQQLELDKELAIQKGDSLNEINRQIAEKELELHKEKNAAIEEESKKSLEIQKKLNEENIQALTGLIEGTGAIIGGILDGSIKDTEDAQKAILKIILDTVEKGAIAQATAWALAQPDSVATFGLTGAARAAVLGALIKAAFSVVKGLISEDGNILESGGVPIDFVGGQILKGPRHREGGIKFWSKARGGRYSLNEAQGEEAVIKKESTKRWTGLLSAINEDQGGRQFSADSYKYKELLKNLKANGFEDGGIPTLDFALSKQPQLVTPYTMNGESRISIDDMIMMAELIAKRQGEVIAPIVGKIPSELADGLDKDNRLKERKARALNQSSI